MNLHVCTRHCCCTVLQVSDLEREVKLKQLSLKDLQKELDTEKALTSKLYDDVRLVCSCVSLCVCSCYLPVPLCSCLKVIHHHLASLPLLPSLHSPFPISPLSCPRMYLIAVYLLPLTLTFLLLNPPPLTSSIPWVVNMARRRHPTRNSSVSPSKKKHS